MLVAEGRRVIETARSSGQCCVVVPLCVVPPGWCSTHVAVQGGAWVHCCGLAGMAVWPGALLAVLQAWLAGMPSSTGRGSYALQTYYAFSRILCR